MKNLLLKIIFAGLTLGLVPQAAAMNSTHSIQLRSRARSNSTNRASHQPDCISLAEIQSRRTITQEDFTESENHDFRHLSPDELDQMKFEEMLNNSEQNVTCFKKFFWMLAILIPYMVLTATAYNQIATPSLSEPYRNVLGIQGDIQCKYVRAIGDYPCFFNSKEYGKVVPIAQELQNISHDNFTIVQLKSKPQGFTDTCLKHAFSNLATIDLLHRNGTAINSENIAQHIQQPLQKISFPEPIESIEWTQVKNPSFLSNIDWVDKLLNHAKTFFPNKNMYLLHLHDPKYENDAIRHALTLATKKLKTQDVFHILLDCKHATALSIIKGKDNKYLIIYMDSNNPPLSSGYDAYYERESYQAGTNFGAYCYNYFKAVITKLREQLTQNK